MTQTEIDQAIKDQIGTNPEEPLPSNPDVAQAVANYAAEAARVAAVINNLQSNYLTGFQNWSQLVMAGKIPNTDPPRPPIGYLAATASDGWTYRIHGGDPVMAMPPIPQVPTASPGELLGSLAA